MRQNYVVQADDLDFLEAHIHEPALIAVFKRARTPESIGTGRRPRTALSLNQSERESLIDQLAELLTAIGLEPDSEPNPVGLRIEALIDVLTSTTV